MLQTQSLRFAYPRSALLSFPDLSATTGQPLLILGQSGVGKTTLLHLLAGLLRPQTGQIWIGDTDLATLSTQALDRFRGQNIGLVFQKAHFVQSLSVEQNLKLAPFLAGKSLGRAHKERPRALMERLGLADKYSEPVHRLSLGEQQRVAIARAVLNRPQVLLADEPTSALDDRSTQDVIELLEDSAREAGAALVIVTHDQRLKDRFGHRTDLGAKG